MLRVAALFGSLVPGGVAAAQEVVTSAAPEAVSVTVYRDSDRSTRQPVSRNFPTGFALITETRTIRVPAGKTVVRFEGVASGILPASALVAGLPRDVTEKNLDADLLNPRSLYDRSLGRQVFLRRTNPATGKVVEQQAVIRSSAAGGLVVQTETGVEALRCTGLPEAIVYPAVPPGLSAKPTLSISTDSPEPFTATITLSYLAGGFDWQADYVATMRPDGKADLFAWITLASRDVTSFADAATQVVAGRLNRSSGPAYFGRPGFIELECWPQGSSGEVSEDYAMDAMAPPPPPPPPPMMAPAPIMVTAARKAVQEELGDLKLYRIPDRVTIASQAQKQVAMLSQTGVSVGVVYVSTVEDDQLSGTVMTLRTRNRRAEGLGVPLPAGRVTIFEGGRLRPMLIGESALPDKAVGEPVEITLAASSAVQVRLTVGPAGEIGRRRVTVEITNANPWPITHEAKIFTDPRRSIVGASRALMQRDAHRVWTAQVPANGVATLQYDLIEP